MSENLQKLLLGRFDRINISVIIVVQVYNVLNITDLLRWLNSIACDYTMELAIDPAILSVAILPDAAKATAARRLERFASECRLEKRRHVLAIAEMIKATPKFCSVTNLLTFKRFTEALDSSRRQRLDDVCPELLQYLSE
ncbi:hypothetical protein [Bradyrhizobium sp. USDA 313]|uniref:hypothetical protein n=1 Tax=Bradyrhizobium sp. USDA 313 TaxID=3156307 RepID=UPI00351684D5